MDVLRRIGYMLESLETVLICVGVFTLAVLLIINVIARNFFVSIFYTEEVAEFLIILITFVGMSYAVRKARHIRMGAIFDAMGTTIKKALIILISTVGATVMFLMAYYSLDYVRWIKMKAIVTPALVLPRWTFYAIMPLMFFIAGIHYVRAVFKNLREPDAWLSAEQQSEYEATDGYENPKDEV